MILIIIKLIVVLCSIKCILVLIDSKMSKDLKVVAVLGLGICDYSNISLRMIK